MSEASIMLISTSQLASTPIRVSPFTTIAKSDAPINDKDVSNILVLASTHEGEYLVSGLPAYYSALMTPCDEREHPLYRIKVDSLHEICDVTRASEHKNCDEHSLVNRYADAAILQPIHAGQTRLCRASICVLLSMAAGMDILEKDLTRIPLYQPDLTQQQIADADAWFAHFVDVLDTVPEDVKDWTIKHPYITACAFVYLSKMYKHDHKLDKTLRLLYAHRKKMFYDVVNCRAPLMRGLTLIHLCVRAEAWTTFPFNSHMCTVEYNRQKISIPWQGLPALVKTILSQPMRDCDRYELLNIIQQRILKYGDAV